jgi:hypothetical protein
VAKPTKTPRKRQAISKEFRKLTQAAEREKKRDLVAQWKELRRLGVYNSKEAPAQSRITPARKRAIEKHFREIQRHGKSVGGKVERPLALQSYFTPSGKIATRYRASGYFDFVKTKTKTDLKAGLIKTKKGYIVEKTSKGAKVRINKKGQVIENVGGVERRLTLYRGKDLMKLLQDMESGKYKLEKDEMIVLKKWGSPNATISVDDDTGAVLLGGYWSGFLKDQPGITKESFLRYSVIEIIKRK